MTSIGSLRRDPPTSYPNGVADRAVARKRVDDASWSRDASVGDVCRDERLRRPAVALHVLGGLGVVALTERALREVVGHRGVLRAEPIVGVGVRQLAARIGELAVAVQ